ncbi:MAG: helix-turn-helix transcriptional regulator [Ruminococcaceae bacterium]|nr:helix-turn-helix transcriptional regulator [Oscillospiraceae bacterium]
MGRSLVALLFGLLVLAGLTLVVYLLILVIRALRKYIRSGEVRRETEAARRSLGEVLKAHRVERQMTQEFVAESLGVSRQAVSKWESGASDPSTSNLLALARLFGVSAEELLAELKP